jgi:hypothetical protein
MRYASLFGPAKPPLLSPTCDGACFVAGWYAGPSHRAGCRLVVRLVVRLGVALDGPHPPVQLVTIAATLERGWSTPTVPTACP